jgi:hypothetical protein
MPQDMPAAARTSSCLFSLISRCAARTCEARQEESELIDDVSRSLPAMCLTRSGFVPNYSTHGSRIKCIQKFGSLYLFIQSYSYKFDLTNLLQIHQNTFKVLDRISITTIQLGNLEDPVVSDAP